MGDPNAQPPVPPVVPEGSGPTNEPVAWGTVIAFAVTESVPFINDVGGHIGQQTQTDLIRLLGVVILIGGFLIRSKVTPVGKAKALITKAYKADPAKGEKKPQL